LASGAEVVVGEARRFRVLIEGTVSAAAAGTQIAAVPSRSQDMEWATRLVFSAEDLEAIAKAAGGIDKPSPPPMRPVGKSPSVPAIPVPTAAEPPTRPQPTIPAPAQVDMSPPEQGTRFAGPDLRVPTGLAEKPPTTPPAADAPAFERTQAEAAPFKPPRFDPARQQPPLAATVPDRTIVEAGPTPGSRNNLPPSMSAPERQSPRRITSVELAGGGLTFTLGPGTATIGRSPDATVRIESRELSRIHAVVTVSSSDVVVEDRGSVNGTMVNGTRITGPTPLSAGDRLAFASVEFRVEVKWTEGT
jgi:hypothetical protein